MTEQDYYLMKFSGTKKGELENEKKVSFDWIWIW